MTLQLNRTILLLVIVLFTTILMADTIILAADPWMPYNGQSDSSNPGYCIEIAKAVFQKAGHKVTYQVLPFSRAIQDASNGKVNGVVGAAKTDVPDFIFPVNEIGISSSKFFVKKNSTWKYDGVKSLKNEKLGVVQDYTYGDETFDGFVEESIKNHSTNVEVARGDAPLEKLINMLLADRISVVVEDGLVMQYTLKHLGKTNDIKLASSLSDASKVYIAFPPNNPKSKEYAKILSDGISDMRASGELKKIMVKYGLTDWAGK